MRTVLGYEKHETAARNETKTEILVTGGAGFLGSNLCEILIGRGHKVICLDNLQTGSLSNIAHLMGGPEFSFIKHDVVEKLPIAGRLDQIYNLACPASPPKYQKDPIHTFLTCVQGAINVLELARNSGASVLQASTSEVYGDALVSPQAEDYRGNVNTFGPRSCYDEGKRSAETLFHDYANAYDVPIRVIRIFNTYGPKMAPDDGRVVSNFILQALTGQDITIYGTGEQTRSFCYVDDLLDGMERVMNLPDKVVEPVNLGNPSEFTVMDLARMVIEKTGTSSRIVHAPFPQDDPLQRRPDISRIKDLTGWEPKVSLTNGLDQTIAHFDDVLNGKLAGSEPAE